MSNTVLDNEPLELGEQVADVELAEKLGGGGGIHLWMGTREDGSQAAVFALDKRLGPKRRDAFLAAATDLKERAIDGVVPVQSVDPIAGAYVGNIEPSGTLADLPVLNWNRKRKVALFTRLCEIVANIHEASLVHGWLRPEHILLDGALEPAVANPGLFDIGNICRTDGSMVSAHKVYAPPEVRHGAAADARADVFSLGRLLHFALAGAEPDEKDERLPRLDQLVGKQPAPMVRIIRKCTSMDASQRYANAREILEDLDRATRHIPVGTPHPEIDGAEESSMVDDAEMRSKPPPAKPPRSTGIAMELQKTAGEIRFWSVGIAIGFGLLALVMIAVPTGAAYAAGADGFVLRLVSWLAAIPIAIAFPGFPPNRALARALVGSAALGVLVFISPIDKMMSIRAEALTAGDVGARVLAVKERIAAGEYDLRALDLSGADLSGMDFSNATLDGSSLKNTVCKGTKFRKSSMLNVDISGADLRDADLNNTIGAFMKFLETAKCSERTVMPSGYVCVKGSPVPANAINEK